MEEIKKLLLDLVSVPSLSNTAGEKEMAAKITEKLEAIPYFAKNPDQLYHWQLPNDEHQRSVEAAYLKKSPRKETVVLLNHHDVVDVQEYDQNRELAFSPLELTEKMSSYPGIKKLIDREGEDYLFGRGVADMKAGLALQLEVLKRLAADQKFSGNLLFISVPDEETSSRGMLTAIRELARLQREEGLEYELVINCEPTFPAYPGDEKIYIYTGSMGKALVFFYALGLETHVGDSLSGLNGNLLIASLINRLENNLDYSETLDNYTSPPPTCLRARDTKEYYSAKIPHISGCYYNFCLLKMGAAELLMRLKDVSGQMMEEVLQDWQEVRNQYFTGGGPDSEPEGWVLTYEEFYREAKKIAGQKVDRALVDMINRGRQEGIEEQELCMQMTDLIKDFAGRSGPGIVLGFTPPFYPPVKSEAGNISHKLARKLIEDAKKDYGYQVDLSPSFPGISDLSYCKIANFSDTQSILQNNLPLWNRGYQLPLREMEKLDIPVINISVQGYDAHKRLERLELNYSLQVVPELVEKACRGIFSS